MNLQSQLRHFFGFLAGIGTMLLSWEFIRPDQVDAVNQAGGDLIAPLAIILGAVGACLFRALISWLGNLFRTGAGEKANEKDGSGPGMSALFVGLGTAVVLGGLPSCSFEYPITGTLRFQDPKTGAKAGLSYSPQDRLRGSVAVPIYDPTTGKRTGYAEIATVNQSAK